MKDPMEQWLEEWIALEKEEQHMTDKQVRIIQAAVEIFSQKGYAASSTSEIARKAGVAEGTIFRHYKTKKDLLLSIVTPMMAKFIAPFLVREFGKVLDDDYACYEDFLRMMMINRTRFIKKNLPVLRILLQEIPFHPELKQQFKPYFIEQILKKIEKIVVRFQQKGDIIRIPPRSVIRMTATSIIGFLFIRYLLAPEAEWDDEQETEHTIQFIMRGLSARDRGDSD